MSEAGMRSNLVKAMKKFHAVPVENRLLPAGMPDINFSLGWIECKWLKAWPRTCNSSPVKFHHNLMSHQRYWMKKRASAGGLVLLCVQVRRDWFFFNADTAIEKFNEMTKPEMEENAMLHLSKGLEKKRLVKWLDSL